MRSLSHRWTVSMPAALFGVLLLAAPAIAAQSGENEDARHVEAVRPWAFKRLDRAYQALSDERYDDCLDALDEMRENPKLNSLERSLLWQTYGYVYSARDEYAKAAESFEKCLEADGLAEQAAIQTRYNLAQLYVMLERYDDAIAQFDYWFAHVRNPSATAFYMTAMAYLQKGDDAQALRYAEKAVEKAKTPRESWLQLLVALRLGEKRYAETVPLLEELVQRFPKKTYWLQLSAVSSELGDPAKALATLELAYLQGLLTEGTELMSLAQMYLYNQIPYRAAEILEEGLKSGMIAADSRSWQLLADSWLHARERDRALPALRRAAELAPNGNVYVRLAQVELEQEHWSEARAALQAALDKGGLDHPGHAHLLLGIANASDKRWAEAEKAFETAREFEETEKVASQWLRHMAAQDEIDEQGRRVGRAAPSEEEAAGSGAS
jgi:tetratricopeptide (TPR) repeat protein